MLLKDKKKKGFVLIETIVVIVVISVSLLTLFASYNKILTKVKEENKYDLSEHLYMTNYIREYLKDSKTITPYELGSSNDGPTNYVDATFSIFGVKSIYIISDINGSETNKNLQYFDAYLIDYIKKLDVDDNTALIVVEYAKTSRDVNYNTIKLYGTKIALEETYIASLEW